MSSQKGNVKKSKPQKYQNKMGFKNSMHDKSKKTKDLNRMNVDGVCSRCKDVIEWKIKYKKYKPLTLAKKCTKCQQKTVLHAYHIICTKCSDAEGICAKCGVPDDDEKTLQNAERAKEGMEKLKLGASTDQRLKGAPVGAQQEGEAKGGSVHGEGDSDGDEGSMQDGDDECDAGEVVLPEQSHDCDIGQEKSTQKSVHFASR